MIGKGNKPIYLFFRKDETRQFARRICCGGGTHRENDVGMAAPMGSFHGLAVLVLWHGRWRWGKSAPGWESGWPHLGHGRGGDGPFERRFFSAFAMRLGLPHRCQWKPQIGQAKGGYGQATKGGATGLLFFVEPGLWSLWIILDHGLSMDSVGSLGISFDNWIPGDSAFLWLTLWGRRCRFLEPK